MPVVAVVGGHWGDEGKGKLVDYLSEHASLVVRANGGRNTGHTVVVGEKEFHFHLVPSGMLYPNVTCVVGPGVVMDPVKMVEELDALRAQGVATDNLVISERAHLVLPYHIELDRLSEAERGEGKIGTTGNGIAPAYTDKWARTGLRAVDLLDTALFKAKYGAALGQKNRLLRTYYGAPTVPVEPALSQILEAAERLRPYIGDTNAVIQRSIAADELVVLEGGQATLLDVDHGTYPFVSTSASSAGLCLGAGIPPNKIAHVYGVFKAYTTRVGEGPFPTEQQGDVADHLRERGREYGVTTGRPRRIGWFDAVAGRYAVEINGVDRIFLSRTDILDDCPSVKICVAYELDGKRINRFPASIPELERCRPVFEEMKGFGPLGQVRTFDELPLEARAFVQRIEELLGAPITLVGTGPGRDQTIVRDHLLPQRPVLVHS